MLGRHDVGWKSSVNWWLDSQGVAAVADSSVNTKHLQTFVCVFSLLSVFYVVCDLFERFVFKSCVFRLKPSNVAYKHASLVPRENDVREHKIFVGKRIVNLCWAYSLWFRVFSRREGLLKSLQWTLAVSSVLVFIKMIPTTRNSCALSVSYWEASSKTFTLSNSAMPTHSRLSCFFLCLPFHQDKKYEAVVLPLFGVATPFHISTIKVRKSFVLRSTDKQCQGLSS